MEGIKSKAVPMIIEKKQRALIRSVMGLKTAIVRRADKR